jgi:HEAT repeat protein
VEALRGQSSAEWRPPEASEIIRFGIVKLTQANAVEVLGDALATSGDRQLRHESAIHLAMLCDPRTSPTFINALTDRHSPVRREAARGLGALHDPDAVPALFSALDDPDKAVRRVARQALVKIGPRLRDVRRAMPQTQPGQNQRRKLLRQLLLRKVLVFRR